jgi:dihydrofolate synthase / folylpolyglutamate synthase
MPENPKQIAARLFARTTKGIKLGLDRMREAAGRFDNPQQSYRSIHVAGTNGKGSTCAYMESALRASGFTTGLFTSPHIVDFEERFIVNGRPVPAARWGEVYADLEKTIEELDLTFFEATTLMAFELFKRENVQWAVFETGLGGRLDSTNILVPKVSVITTIAMDHQHYLGNDLLSIAGEKLGIIKRRVPLVMAEPSDPAVRRLALSLCLQNSCPCIFAAPSAVTPLEEAGQATAFSYHGARFTLPLAGDHQLTNALCAIKALAAAGIRNLTTVSDGIAATILPGRFQVIKRNGATIIFDVGHNPDAAAAFVKTLEKHFPAIKPCMVVGIMKDKDSKGMFEAYCSRAGRLVLVHPAIDRAAQTSLLAQSVPAWFEGKVEQAGDVGEAALKACASGDEVVCITGSFYTVGEAMQKLGVSPYPKQGGG